MKRDHGLSLLHILINTLAPFSSTVGYNFHNDFPVKYQSATIISDKNAILNNHFILQNSKQIPYSKFKALRALYDRKMD